MLFETSAMILIWMAIQFGTRQILYHLHRTDRKSLRIVVSPEMTVDIFAPKTASHEEIRSVVKKKAAWIARTLDKMEVYHPLPAPKRYLSGETFVYLGRRYRLKVEEGKSQAAKLSGRFLFVGVEGRKDAKSVKRKTEAWYRKRARETLSRYIEECYTIASRHNVPEPLLVIRVMRRRWVAAVPQAESLST